MIQIPKLGGSNHALSPRSGYGFALMSPRPSTTLAECVCATAFQGFVFGNTGTAEAGVEG
jgi:hypothetical protein